MVIHYWGRQVEYKCKEKTETGPGLIGGQDYSNLSDMQQQQKVNSFFFFFFFFWGGGVFLQGQGAQFGANVPFIFNEIYARLVFCHGMGGGGGPYAPCAPWILQ